MIRVQLGWARRASQVVVGQGLDGAALGPYPVDKVPGGAAQVVADNLRPQFLDELQQARFVEHCAHEEQSRNGLRLPATSVSRTGPQLGKELCKERVEFLTRHSLRGIQDVEVGRRGELFPDGLKTAYHAARLIKQAYACLQRSVRYGAPGKGRQASAEALELGD